jgi:microcystin degradation protein MlrC
MAAGAGRVHPVVAVAKLPLLSVPQGQFTAREPMQSLVRLAHAWEARPGLLTCSVFPGFAYADVPNGGFAATAVADGSRDLAAAAALAVAQRAWELRDAFTVQNVAPSEAVAKAMSVPAGLVALVDVGDNIGGGTPGDGTVLLAELLRRHARSAIVTLADPEAAQQARAIGVGGRFLGAVGGKVDPRYGEPVPLTGTVRFVGDGRFRYRCGFMTGKEVFPGLTAVIDADAVEVVLTEHKVPTWDPEQLRVIGVEPALRRIVVLKAAVAWRAGYEPLVSAVVEADTPGACATNLAHFAYRHLPGPVYPLATLPGDAVRITTGRVR